MAKEAKYHDNTYSLELKKIWDPNDPTLFCKIDRKYTAQGYTAYWEAVDKAVKYAETLLFKKEAKKMANKKAMLAKSSIRTSKKTLTTYRDDKFHWHRKDYSKH